MNDLIKEVKEDLKRERFDKIFNQHGTSIIGLALIIVFGVAAGSWYNGYRISQQENTGELYRNAIIAEEFEAQRALLEKISTEGTSGYQQLAAFSRAKTLSADEHFDKAVNAYDEIRKDNVVEEELQQLADFLALSIQINQNMDASVINERFTRLAHSDLPWHASVKELQASYLFDQRDTAQSIKLFTELTVENNTPPAIKQRAQQIISMLTNNKRESE